MDNDILKELSLNDLNKLKNECVQKPSKKSFHLENAIDVAIEWKSHDFPEILSVFSPWESWKIDSSIAIVVNLNLTIIFVYSNDETYEKIRESLIETKRIDKSKPCRIYHYIFEGENDVVPHVLENWKMTIKEKCDTFFFIMEKSKAKAIQIELPDDVYIAELKKEDAIKINNEWPHKYHGSEEDVTRIIERCTIGYGVFAKKGNELVAWALRGYIGRINSLHTAEEHRGKGYGKIILKVITKKIAESGHVPVGAVLLNNIVSANLFRSLGFEIQGVGYHMTLNPYD